MPRFLSCHWTSSKENLSSLFSPSVIYTRVRSLWAFYSPDCTVPVLSTSPHRRDAPTLQPSWWPFPGIIPVSPYLSCTAEPSTGPSTPNVSPGLSREGSCPLTCWLHPSLCTLGCWNCYITFWYRIIDFSRLEKTHKIIKNNCHLTLPSAPLGRLVVQTMSLSITSTRFLNTSRDVDLRVPNHYFHKEILSDI